jgi:hypothetical protein
VSHNRSAAALRVIMRRWHVFLECGLAVCFGLALLACWYFDLHGYWWLLCGLGIVSTLIGTLADINAYFDTRQRLRAIDKSGA